LTVNDSGRNDSGIRQGETHRAPCSIRSACWSGPTSHFEIKRLRSDALTVTAAIVGERIEIDVFEDEHIEISRFRGDESIEGGKDLLLDIVMTELRENYPQELPDAAAK